MRSSTESPANSLGETVRLIVAVVVNTAIRRRDHIIRLRLRDLGRTGETHPCLRSTTDPSGGSERGTSQPGKAWKRSAAVGDDIATPNLRDRRLRRGAHGRRDAETDRGGRLEDSVRRRDRVVRLGDRDGWRAPRRRPSADPQTHPSEASGSRCTRRSSRTPRQSVQGARGTRAAFTVPFSGCVSGVRVGETRRENVVVAWNTPSVAVMT